jgi:hypothetical protein
VTSGRVVSGHVEIEGEPLPDGAIVTVLARDADESFELDAAAEAALLPSLVEADRAGEDYLYPARWFVSVSVPESVGELLHDLAIK